jgi:hypothetical protein
MLGGTETGEEFAIGHEDVLSGLARTSFTRVAADYMLHTGTARVRRRRSAAMWRALLLRPATED